MRTTIFFTLNGVTLSFDLDMLETAYLIYLDIPPNDKIPAHIAAWRQREAIGSELVKLGWQVKDAARYAALAGEYENIVDLYNSQNLAA